MRKPQSLPKLLQTTQTIFNKWIRKRDKDLGCISCNGQVEQAGHYFSQGHYSALRYNEINTNGQCVRCNMYLSGNLINYRQGLVKRYGEQAVKDLEQYAEIHKRWKWDRTELLNLQNKYK
jgi:Bacteriophage Lambda NinG protein